MGEASSDPAQHLQRAGSLCRRLDPGLVVPELRELVSLLLQPQEIDSLHSLFVGLQNLKYEHTSNAGNPSV